MMKSDNKNILTDREFLKLLEILPIGFQAESQEALKGYLRMVKHRNLLIIEKEVKPSWWFGSDWGELYSFQLNPRKEAEAKKLLNDYERGILR